MSQKTNYRNSSSTRSNEVVKSAFDKFGSEMRVGTYVAIARGSMIKLATVTKVNPRQVEVSVVGFKPTRFDSGMYARRHDSVIVVDDAEVTLHLLKKIK